MFRRIVATLRRYWWILLLGLFVGFGIWWRFFRVQTTSEVITVRPSRGALLKTLEVSGVVDAHEQVSLAFPAPGRLAWVGVVEGDTVKQWQTVASLDTRTLEKQLTQDLNLFGKEFRDHDQTLDDTDFYGYPEITTSLRRIWEKAQFDLDNTVLQVEIRDLAIKLASLSTPIAGLVTRVDTPYAGVTVGVTDRIEIVNPTSVYFAAVVDEEDIQNVSEGQSAQIILDSFDEMEIQTQVELIDFTPSPTQSGGTGYRISLPLTVDNQFGRYRMGMNGTAVIRMVEKTDVLKVPVDSLISRDGKDFGDVLLANGETESREITLGIESIDEAEVLSGLSEDDLVIIPTQ